MATIDESPAIYDHGTDNNLDDMDGPLEPPPEFVIDPHETAGVDKSAPLTEDGLQAPPHPSELLRPSTGAVPQNLYASKPAELDDSAVVGETAVDTQKFNEAPPAEEAHYAEGNYAEEGAHAEEGDYAEGDYAEGDYAEGDYAEGHYTEGDYVEEGGYAEEGAATLANGHQPQPIHPHAHDAPFHTESDALHVPALDTADTVGTPAADGDGPPTISVLVASHTEPFHLFSSSHPSLLATRADLYAESLTHLFAALKNDVLFRERFRDNLREMTLSIPSLNLTLGEDNVLSASLCLRDLTILQMGADLSAPIVFSIGENEYRFSTNFHKLDLETKTKAAAGGWGFEDGEYPLADAPIVSLPRKYSIDLSEEPKKEPSFNMTSQPQMAHNERPQKARHELPETLDNDQQFDGYDDEHQQYSIQGEQAADGDYNEEGNYYGDADAQEAYDNEAYDGEYQGEDGYGAEGVDEEGYYPPGEVEEGNEQIYPEGEQTQFAEEDGYPEIPSDEQYPLQTTDSTNLVTTQASLANPNADEEVYPVDDDEPNQQGNENAAWQQEVGTDVPYDPENEEYDPDAVYDEERYDDQTAPDMYGDLAEPPSDVHNNDYYLHNGDQSTQHSVLDDIYEVPEPDEGGFSDHVDVKHIQTPLATPAKGGENANPSVFNGSMHEVSFGATMSLPPHLRTGQLGSYRDSELVSSPITDEAYNAGTLHSSSSGTKRTWDEADNSADYTSEVGEIGSGLPADAHKRLRVQ